MSRRKSGSTAGALLVVAFVGYVALGPNSEKKTTSAPQGAPNASPTRDISLVFRKVFNRPQVEGHGSAARDEWAAAFSKVSPREATFSTRGPDDAELFVQYGPDSADRICDPGRWESELHFVLARMRFASVTCGTNSVPVPKDAKAERDIAIEDGNAVTQKLDAGLVGNESDFPTATAIIGQGKCNRIVLGRLLTALKHAKVDLRAVGFSKLACSVDDAVVDIQ